MPDLEPACWASGWTSLRAPGRAEASPEPGPPAEPGGRRHPASGAGSAARLFPAPAGARCGAPRGRTDCPPGLGRPRGPLSQSLRLPGPPRYHPFVRHEHFTRPQGPPAPWGVYIHIHIHTHTAVRRAQRLFNVLRDTPYAAPSFCRAAVAVLTLHSERVLPAALFKGETRSVRRSVLEGGGRGWVPLSHLQGRGVPATDAANPPSGLPPSPFLCQIPPHHPGPAAIRGVREPTFWARPRPTSASPEFGDAWVSPCTSPSLRSQLRPTGLRVPRNTT